MLHPIPCEFMSMQFMLLIDLCFVSIHYSVNYTCWNAPMSILEQLQAIEVKVKGHMYYLTSTEAMVDEYL